MGENKTTYQRKVTLALDVYSAYPIDDTIAGAVKDALDENWEAEPLVGSVEIHSCPKFAAGSVDAAFQRIDKLEERLAGLVEKVFVAGLAVAGAAQQFQNMPEDVREALLKYLHKGEK